MDLPIQWLERYGLPHGKKVSSVDAIICVSAHSGGHTSHGPASPMATLMRAIASHRRWRECYLCVDTSCKAYGVLDPCACSNHTDGYDMPAGLASLTQFLCCAYVCRFCLIYCGLRFNAQSHSDNGQRPCAW